MEKSRTIIGKRYKYIRHDHPMIPFDAGQAYLEFYRPALHVMRQLQKEGKLTPEQAFFLVPHKPEEELYDLQNDPHELVNLAGSDAHRAILQELKTELVSLEQQMQSEGPTELVWPGAVDVLAWTMQNRPELYQQMLEGVEIGFSKMVRAYREATQQE
jgi:arylsulfatase A-like enzyme